MDFHKLQQTLNNIEPSDRNRDIELLKQSANGNNSPSLREEVSESVEQPIARAPMSEAAQMAALAGIPLNEEQKTGRPGQVKGSEAVKSKSKPTDRGEQEHPFDDRLVGHIDTPRENTDDNIEEGPGWDKVKKDWAQGYKNFNTPSALKSTGSKGAKSKGSTSTTASQNDGQLSPKMARELAKYEAALIKISKDPQLGREFRRLMRKASPTEIIAPESKKYTQSTHQSIKETLLHKLNQKK
jgi:hypothetical protein